MCDRVGVPSGSSDTVMYEGEAVKQIQEAGGVRNVGCLLQEVLGSEWNQPKRQAT